MKRHILLTLSLLFPFLAGSLSAYSQQYKWVKGGGSNVDVSMSTAWRPEAVLFSSTDYNGNIYVLSAIGNGPMVADTFYRPSAYGVNANVLFASYTCSGVMRFAKLISGAQIVPQGIATDESGHVYIGMDLPHGSSSPIILRIGYDTTITGATLSRRTLLQYDTSGHLNWLRFLGNNTTTSYSGTGGVAHFVAVDGDDNPHLIDYLYSNVVLSSSVVTQYGIYDSKYDASGNLLSAKRLQLDSTLGPSGVTIDRQSNKLYLYGNRSPAFPDSSFHAFIAAFDTNRNLIWKDTISDPGYVGSQGFTGIASDNVGSIYLSGGGQGKVIYRSDTAKNTLLAGGALSFIMKLDTGSNFKWFTTYSGSTSVGSMQDICLMPGNKVAAGGLFAGKVRSGTDSIVIYSGEGQNSFLTVVDTAGSLFTLQQLHGIGFYDAIASVISDRTGSLYVGGQIETNTWAGSLSPYTSYGGNTDYYLMKYGTDCDCISGPLADFTATGTHTVNFTYTGTPGSTAIDSVRWYFGDGGTSTLLSPAHIYSAAGTFHVCVRVYSSCGGDVECHDVVITCPYTPAASFTVSGSYIKNFTYTGTTAGVDSVRWYFGDGGTSTSWSPIHTYTLPGTYTACVRIYTWCAWDSTCITFTIPCVSAPIATFTSSGTGATRNFTYTGTTIAMDSIRWYFGDGGTSTAASPTHLYTAIGTYTVCVTFYNSCGSSTVCHVVTIPCVGMPVAAFSSSGTAGHKDFSYFGSTVGVDSVGWNFGDGWRTTATSASHTYTALGIFHVCVYAYSACGNDTLCYDVEVLCLTPTVSFTHSTTADSFGHFLYTGSTTSVDSVRWSFGDGTAATGTTVNHQYGSTGIYTVCAIAFSACGNDTVCDTIKIYSLASIDIEGLRLVTILPNPVRNELVIEHAANCDFAIYNLLGQKMLSGHIADDRHISNVAQLPNAIYIIQVTAPEGSKRSLRLFKE